MDATEKHPRGLSLLFGVEMWERFSFYGMRSLLALFLISTAGGYGWSKHDAGVLYSFYTGLVYLTGMGGGYIADRWLGYHRALLTGSAFIAAGHFLLAAPMKGTFFLGLALIVVGTGFHKPVISTMVGKLYRDGDPRRDAGFTIFYMGINIGGLLGPLVCGYLAKSERFGWHWGFAAAGVGMVLGTVLYIILKRRLLGDIGDVPPSRDPKLHHGPLTTEEKQRVAAILIMAFFNIFFWMAYEQTGSSMSYFAEERTNRLFLGLTIPAPWFQSVNSAVIMIFAPLFAWLWTALGRRGLEPSTPVKFAGALFLVSAGFVVMVVGARLSEGGHRVSPLFLVAAFTLHTWGELCLSPVGLSMVVKLAPARHASFLMGVWWVSFCLGDFAAGQVAALVENVEKGQVFRLFGGQADFFFIFVVVPAAGALALLALVPVLKRFMHGRA
jgi:POT family proton-dependent oligopeptide transporter